MGRKGALTRLSPSTVAAVMATASSITDAARELGVDKGTISRWVASGKAPKPGQAEMKQEASDKASAVETPEAWGEWVRQKFTLSRSELELVMLAEIALRIAKDPDSSPNEKMVAATRFQALLNQLKLEPETKGQAEPQSPVDTGRALPRRRAGADPRALLMAVK